MLSLHMDKTLQEYDAVVAKCRDLFSKKMADYGSAWRILRLSSLTDQIFIKAQRIRSVQQKGLRKVAEGDESAFMGIINYGLMALIQLDLGVAERPDLASSEALSLFDAKARAARELMVAKNHDYGEAWRGMRIASLTDMILQKLLRIKQIEDNDGQTLVSEGLDANYLDIINYAVFSLVKQKGQKNA